jgi:hypothetical protein
VTDLSPTTRPETPNHQFHRTHCSGLRPLSWAGELTRSTSRTDAFGRSFRGQQHAIDDEVKHAWFSTSTRRVYARR